MSSSILYSTLLLCDERQRCCVEDVTQEAYCVRTRLFNSAFGGPGWTAARPALDALNGSGEAQRRRWSGPSLAQGRDGRGAGRACVRACTRSFPHSTLHLFLRTVDHNHPSFPSFHLLHTASHIYYTSIDQVVLRLIPEQSSPLSQDLFGHFA